MLIAKLKVACCAVVALFGIGALSLRDVSPSINGLHSNTASAAANEPQNKRTPEAKKSKEAEKLYSMEFYEAPWSKVIEWFTGVSGLAYTSCDKPISGTFSFIPPVIDGKPKQYTIAQIVEILNERLKPKGYVLVVGGESFSIGPLDVPTADEAKKADKNERLFAIRFRDVSWRKVIEWFINASGLAYSASVVLPDDTFSFAPPVVDGKPRRYTLAQIAEIINEGLKPKGLVLIVRAESFGVVAQKDAREQLAEELHKALARAKAAEQEARAQRDEAEKARRDAEKERDLLKKELDALRKELQRLKELQKK